MCICVINVLLQYRACGWAHIWGGGGAQTRDCPIKKNKLGHPFIPQQLDDPLPFSLIFSIHHYHNIILLFRICLVILNGKGSLLQMGKVLFAFLFDRSIHIYIYITLFLPMHLIFPSLHSLHTIQTLKRNNNNNNKKISTI